MMPPFGPPNGDRGPAQLEIPGDEKGKLGGLFTMALLKSAEDCCDSCRFLRRIIDAMAQSADQGTALTGLHVKNTNRAARRAAKP
jgi:hypothetical protein